MTLHQLVVVAGSAELLALVLVLTAQALPARGGGQLRLPLRARRAGRPRLARAAGTATGPAAPATLAAGPPATAPPGRAAAPGA